MNLSVIDYIGRINRLYRLIRMEHTGSLKELAGMFHAGQRADGQQLSGGAQADGSRHQVQPAQEHVLFRQPLHSLRDL